MNFKRIIKHFLVGPSAVHQAFSVPALAAITAAIKRYETTHTGEIRFAIEASLNWSTLRNDISARERAIDVFSELRIWDTEQNNGVLIYLLLAERKVEIVADRGLDKRVGAVQWQTICRAMEFAFTQGRFEAGVINGVEAISLHLRQYFPAEGANTNELPDEPVIL